MCIWLPFTPLLVWKSDGGASESIDKKAALAPSIPASRAIRALTPPVVEVEVDVGTKLVTVVAVVAEVTVAEVVLVAVRVVAVAVDVVTVAVSDVVERDVIVVEVPVGPAGVVAVNVVAVVDVEEHVLHIAGQTWRTAAPTSSLVHFTAL